MNTSTNHLDCILVVEDQEISALAAVSILKDAGFNALQASDGEKALNLLNDGLMPRLILLDVFMPVMNGYEFLKRLKANELWKDIPVVMLTVLAESDDVLRALKYGAVDYCIKPLDSDDIIKTIQRFV